MNDRPISREVARQAAHWLMRLHDGPLNSTEHQACAHWRAADPEHERAWERVQQVQEKLGLLPPELAMGTLNRERRQTLKSLLVLAALLPAGYVGYRSLPWPSGQADYQTAVGQRRQIELADGSLIILNTDTAIDVHFSAEQRLVRLLRGEILVDSGADSQSPIHRPLRVQSEQGVMQALGTRFNVRQLGATTRLAVLEGKVRITPLAGSPQVIEAGEQVSFSAGAVGPAQPAPEQGSAWTRGQLIVDDMPLGQFIAELDRYRPGFLRCAGDAAHLRISGGFQLDSTDAILAALPATLPVTLAYRTRYWVTVSKR